MLPWIRGLLIPAVLLPMLLAVLFGLGGLLTAIGDATGAAVVGYLGAGCLALWITSIAILAMAVAAHLISSESNNE